MRLSLPLGTAAVGAAIAIALIALYGSVDIGKAIVGVGWGLLLIIAFHLSQLAFSSLAWRSVLPQHPPPRLPMMMALRWIREAINALLPVAQIGGEFVSVRLLGMAGVPIGAGAAGVAVDLTLEMLTQIIFTLLGLALLIPYSNAILAPWVLGGIGIATAVLLVVISAQRFGVFHLIERGLIRLSKKMGWPALGEIAGLHEAITELYKSPAHLCTAGGYHLISWLLGGLEVMLALHLVGVSVDFRNGLIIESIGQAMRAVGFAVPASLGVQEAGYVLVCGLVGVSPQAAIELSLLKRIRELAFGIPGLAVWYTIEGRRFFNRLGLARSSKRQSELAP